MTPDPLIDLRAVTRGFGSPNAQPALRGVDLRIDAGEFVAISGPSGSGKSTLMNIIGLLDRPTSGQYRLRGRDVASLDSGARARARRDMIGFVFQDYHLIPTLDLSRNVELPAVYAGLPRSLRLRRATALLHDFGLGDRPRALPPDLSGGEQQRVAIARALMNGGDLILADEPTGALDSRTGAEVLRILCDLAAAGHTIVMITHDPKVAALADRRVEMADGRVVSDSGPADRPARAAPSRAGPPARPARMGVFGEAGRMALASLGANPVRTVLTLLGIVMGVAALIATSAISRGNQAVVSEQMAALGTDWIIMGPMDRGDITSGRPVTAADVEAMSEVPNVAAVMPGIWATAMIQRGNLTASPQLLGTTTAFKVVHDWETTRGGFFTESDVAGNAPVLLLGSTVAGKLFPDGSDPSGSFVLVDGRQFLVGGALASKGFDEFGEDRDDMIVMPLSTMVHRLTGEEAMSNVVIQIADMSRLEETKETLRALLVARHGREDFWLWDAAATFRESEASRAAMSRVVIAISGLSFLVGGIGVMNVMLMTVQQRRREIGIRSATGAMPRDIARQFLIEALVLSALGAVAGLLLGVAIAVGGALTAGTTVIFSVRIVIAVLVGAVAVGVVFGLAPALQAARLDPVASLAS